MKRDHRKKNWTIGEVIDEINRLLSYKSTSDQRTILFAVTTYAGFNRRPPANVDWFVYGPKD